MHEARKLNVNYNYQKLLQKPKKNSRTEKIQKKNIVHNKPIEKKNRARLGVILKIVMQLF
jgi:hypothetical protein